MGLRYEKGSAEAATSPSPGSHITHQEMLANGQDHNSSGAVVPGSISFTVPADFLERFTAEEVEILGDTLWTLSQVGSGLVSQPRNWSGQRYNAAGQFLEGIFEFLDEVIMAVVSEAENRDVTAPKDIELLALTRLRLKASWGDPLSDVASVGAHASHRQSAAERSVSMLGRKV